MINNDKNIGYGKLFYLKTQELEKNMGKSKIKLNTISNSIDNINTSIETLEGQVTDLRANAGGNFKEDDFFMYTEDDYYNGKSRNYDIKVITNPNGYFHVFCRFRIHSVVIADTFNIVLKADDVEVISDSVDIATNGTYDVFLDKIFLNSSGNVSLVMNVTTGIATTGFKINKICWSVQGDDAQFNRKQTPRMGMTQNIRGSLVYRITDSALHYEIQNHGEYRLPAVTEGVFSFISIYPKKLYFQITKAKIITTVALNSETGYYDYANKFIILMVSGYNSNHIIDPVEDKGKTISTGVVKDFTATEVADETYNMFLLNFEEYNGTKRIRLTKWLNYNQTYYCNIASTKLPNINKVTRAIIPQWVNMPTKLVRGMGIYILEDGVVRWVKEFTNYANLVFEDFMYNGQKVYGEDIYSEMQLAGYESIFVKVGDHWDYYDTHYDNDISDYVVRFIRSVDLDVDTILYHRDTYYYCSKGEETFVKDCPHF